MAIRVEPRPVAVGWGHDLASVGSTESVCPATALLQALELALLAARQITEELDAARGCDSAGPRGAEADRELGAFPPVPPRPVLTLHPLSDLCWASGRVAEVDRRLAEARAAFARLAALLARGHADRLAAAVVPVWHLHGLTEREVAVLRLVAAGQSNREAAAALVVSKRTVERHLENLYRKIGARNRADATAYALRNNVT